jgi:AP-2 complex subunit alpha
LAADFDSQGYLAVTLLLAEGDDLVRLVINSIRKDLEDRHEQFNSVALQAIANLGGQEVAESLAPDVYKLLINSCPFVPIFSC